MAKIFDPTKPVQTRDGSKARIICTNAKGRQPICALVEECPDIEVAHRFNNDGSYPYDGGEHSKNLVNVPEKHEYWINLYQQGSCVQAGTVHASKKDADNHGEGRISCIHHVWEE